jgi:hypothetical protein
MKLIEKYERLNVGQEPQNEEKVGKREEVKNSIRYKTRNNYHFKFQFGIPNHVLYKDRHMKKTKKGWMTQAIFLVYLRDQLYLFVKDLPGMGYPVSLLNDGASSRM